MSIHQKIMDDWKQALKNRDFKKDSLSMILSEFKNKAIHEKIIASDGRFVSDQMAIEVLRKMAKQRRETADIYKNADRQDLVDKELKDLTVIEEYLPKGLNQKELQDLVTKAIKEVSASSMKDIGKVMPVAIKLAAGRADGKEIQKIAQAMLGK